MYVETEKKILYNVCVQIWVILQEVIIMKQAMKRSLSVILALAMIMSLCVCSFSATVSGEEVIHRAIQRQWDAKWKNYYIGGRTM